MRALHSSDSHIGLRRYGEPIADLAGNTRVVDFLATYDQFVEVAVRERVDLAILAGDLLDTRTDTPFIRARLSAGLYVLNAAGIPVILCSGNHDGADTPGNPASHAWRWLRELNLPLVTVITTPVVGQVIATPSGSVSLVGLPYPHQRSFDELLPDLTPEQRVIEAGGRLEAIIEAYAAEARDGHPDLPQLFVGHLSVGNMRLGSEQSMSFRWDVAIRPEVLDGFDYAALGHLHKQQPVGRKGWYAGAPDYIDFSEEHDDKSFLLVEFGPDQEPVVAHIPTGARRLVTIDVTADEGLDEQGYNAVLDGAIVRLRVTAERVPDGALARLEGRLSEQGASFIKTEVLTPPRAIVARAEVDPDLDPEEATRRFLTATGSLTEEVMRAARTIIAGVQEGR